MAGNPEREVLACGWIRMMRVRCGRLTPEESVATCERMGTLRNEKIMKA